MNKKTKDYIQKLLDRCKPLRKIHLKRIRDNANFVDRCFTVGTKENKISRTLEDTRHKQLKRQKDEMYDLLDRIDAYCQILAYGE